MRLELEKRVGGGEVSTQMALEVIRELGFCFEEQGGRWEISSKKEAGCVFSGQF